MTNKKLSLKDRALAAVTTRQAVDAAAVVAAPPAPPKTGPGALMAHLAKESTVQRENDQLRTALETWEGATPARKLDPTLVKPSRWANRHPDSFRTAAFDAFKEEIRLSGGNVQPAKVRPSPGTDGEFEIVFGLRRHRACLEKAKSELEQAAEMLVFGTTPHVTAATEFAGRPVGDGKPGPVWRELSRAFEDDLKNPAMRTPARPAP